MATVSAAAAEEERFDLVDPKTGIPTGVTERRSIVHRTGLYHRAVHIWLLYPPSGELLLQRRAACKDSWPDRYDISCAGHLAAGDDSLTAAVRELEEELGLVLPASRLELLFTHLEELQSVQGGRPFINNEFNNVYLVSLTDEERAALQPVSLPLSEPRSAGGGFTLQESEVSAVAYFPWTAVRDMYASGDPAIVPLSDWPSYERLFAVVEGRCAAMGEAR